jgi:ABC-type transporter Mla subunit MlaD
MGRGSRNNVLAGLLVIGAILASLVIITLLGGYYEKIGKVTRVAVFDINEGVAGLKAGSEVRLGGLKVGQVSGVAPKMEGDKVTGMEVTLQIDPKAAPLRKGAVAYLEQGLLGSVSNLNFTSLGDGDPLTATDVIDGRIAAPGFLAAAGYGDEQKTQVQAIIADTESTIKKVKAEVEEFSAKRSKWYGDFDVITDDGKKVMAGAASFVEKDVPDLRERGKAALDEITGVAVSARAFIEEHKASVAQTIKNAEDGTQTYRELGDQLKNQTIKLIEDTVTDARTKTNSALETAKSMLSKVDASVSENVPVVRSTMAKFRLTGDQLAATLAEVRRSPWRLVYRPDKRDYEFELLYDSARAYAQSVSELSSAAEALKGLSDGSGGLKAGNSNVDALLKDLDVSMGKFQEAEAEFMRKVKEKAK